MAKLTPGIHDVFGVDAELEAESKKMHTATTVGSVTRPSNTTQYTAGDAVTNSVSAPTVITFPNASRSQSGSGAIIGGTLSTSANQASKGSFEIWIFSATVTPDNDNAVFTPTDAELLTFVGILRFIIPYVGDATSGAGGNVIYTAEPSEYNLTFTTGVNQNLYGLLVVRNDYTPVSDEVFNIKLRILQD